MSLRWFIGEEERVFNLEKGKTYRIGRKDIVLYILDETAGNLIPMDIGSLLVSRFNPAEGKYGSVVIKYKEDGSIKIYTAKNSTNDVEILELPVHAPEKYYEDIAKRMSMKNSEFYEKHKESLFLYCNFKAPREDREDSDGYSLDSNCVLIHIRGALIARLYKTPKELTFY